MGQVGHTRREDEDENEVASRAGGRFLMGGGELAGCKVDLDMPRWFVSAMQKCKKAT